MCEAASASVGSSVVVSSSESKLASRNDDTGNWGLDTGKWRIGCACALYCHAELFERDKTLELGDIGDKGETGPGEGPREWVREADDPDIIVTDGEVVFEWSEASESGKDDDEVDGEGDVSGVSAIILDGVCGTGVVSDKVTSSAEGVAIGDTANNGSNTEEDGVVDVSCGASSWIGEDDREPITENGSELVPIGDGGAKHDVCMEGKKSNDREHRGEAGGVIGVSYCLERGLAGRVTVRGSDGRRRLGGETYISIWESIKLSDADLEWRERHCSCVGRADTPAL